MLKKALIGVGVLILLGAAYTLMTNKSASPKSVKSSLQKKEPPPVWGGEGERVYNATLTQRGDSLTLQSVDFKDLNYSKASLTVNLEVTSSEGTPKWLRARNFKGFISPNSQLNNIGYFIKPSGFQVSTAQASQIVKVSFSGIPTINLGPTCLQEKQADGPVPEIPKVPFMLAVEGLPGGSNWFATVAPPAPDGLCLADPEAIAQQRLLLRMRNSGIRVSQTIVRGSTVQMKGVTTVQGLEKLIFQGRMIGSDRPWRTLRTQPANGRWRASFKLPAKGRWALRVGGSGEVIGGGTIYPKTALRTVQVG